MKLYSKEMPPDQAAEINEQLFLAFIALNRIPIIAKRIFLFRLFGDTFDEIAGKTNRSRERCRQIEMKVRRYLTAVFSAADKQFFDDEFFPKWPKQHDK